MQRMVLMNFNFSFKYKADGCAKETSVCDNGDFTVKLDENADKITLRVVPKKEIEFSEFRLSFKHKFKKNDRIFTNGYQSWTVSKEYCVNESMSEFKPRVLGIEKRKFNPLGIWGSGDLTFHKYPEKSGVFYGYSYAYVRNGNELFLLGSLSERSGYTIITFDCTAGTITIEKDFDGVIFSDEFEALSLAVLSGEYDDAFDKYFEMMNIPAPRLGRKCGYTTWYNYYTNVTQSIVERDLISISKLDAKVDIFQIDDGYERTVGDWLITDSKKFPDGMKVIADKIHKNNLLAGLWLAPFAVTPKSYIYKQHKDWLVKDERGKIKYASHNWGGFYALDIYNDGAREYIKKVFDTVLNEWGYDMVKLDFLYACCIIPIHNKSRGEIMCDAVELIKECCADKIVLGCGVPLAPAFGKFDFCRIGADVGLSWEDKAYSREDVSTQHTLNNTIYRRHLDGRAWLNDPDVFLLRDNNIKMSLAQRRVIAKVNSLCGNLLFVSDDVASYSDEQKEIFYNTIKSQKNKIISAQIKDGIACIETTQESFSFDILTGQVK